MTDYNLNLLLKDIRKTKPISKTKENELLNDYKETGNPIAKEKLITANLRYVLARALKFKGYNIPIPDLVSEGTIGLSTAIDKFDVSTNIKLITYATCWIDATIQQFIKNKSKLIRTPFNKFDLNFDFVSFDAPIKEDNKHTFADVIEDHNSNIYSNTYYASALRNVIKNTKTNKNVEFSKDQSDLISQMCKEDTTSVPSSFKGYNKQQIMALKNKAFANIRKANASSKPTMI